MKKRVKIQKLKEISGREQPGEHSPYWDYMRTHESIASSHGPNGVDMNERPEANPDVLAESGDVMPSTPQLLMGEAVEHLQGRQLEVYFLTMREGKSLAEAAEILGIEKGSAQKYKERAIKFIRQYCENAMTKGRV
jgi:DNA-directed RNA polymerase specialized sigma24 family protein